MKNEELKQVVASHRAVTCLAALVSGVLLSRFPSFGLDARWIFLASIAVFGLAHGACDLWLPGWVAGRAMSRRFIAIFCLVYVGFAGVVLLFWWVQPGAALPGWWVAWRWPGDFLCAYLILLSAVTLPHALLVLWLDRVETLQRVSTGG